MNKHFTGFLLLLLSTLHFNASAQVFWTEAFDAVPCASSCALPYTGVNGTWTNFVTGVPGLAPNVFYVSCAENGMAANTCGDVCAGDNSLHVGAATLMGGDMGAAYFSGLGSGGIATTSIRAESPVINCSAHTGITLSFNYIEGGAGVVDNAQVWYFDGTTWSMLSDMAKTQCCNGLGSVVPCTGIEQGYWQAFSIALPASANNNANVRIGFSWVNNDDGVGTDPSFAVDDITLSSASTPTAPVAGFTFAPVSPCVGDVVTFTNTSTGTGLTYSWTFAGGTPATSTAANPTVTFATPGPHSVTLTVTDASSATDTETQTVTVVSCGSAPVANFSFPTPVCAGTPVVFTNTSTGGPFTSALWTFVGGTPGSSSALGSTAPITFATTGPHNVTLIISNASGSDTVTQTVNVVSCTSTPVAGFTLPPGPYCQGQCIPFTNTTSGTPPMTYAWITTGGTPSTSTAANPTICYNTPGTYTIILVANNASGTDSVSQTITINSCTTAPTANFNTMDTICRGQCLNFFDLSTGIPTSWTWSFAGATPASSTVQNPTTVCYNTVGTFPITLVVSNAAGSSTITKNIVVVNCSPPSSGFSMNNSRICLGQCITLNNVTSFGTSYLWDFPGGIPSSSTLQQPGKVCYDSTGAFQITLIAFNAFGSDTTIQNVIVDTIPIIEAFPDEVAVTLGNSVELSVFANSDDVTYEWITTDTASIGDTSLAVVTVTPTAPGSMVYYIEVTGENGCTATDSVLVEVELTDVIAVPNAFSPNGDGHNEMLKVLGPGITSMRFIIYNRYGQLVFESTNQEIGWDGKHNGVNVDPGVFAWYLEYTLSNSSTGILKGNVTLIR